MHVEDVAELLGIKIDADEEGVDTVLGLLGKRLGRVPIPGAAIIEDGYEDPEQTGGLFSGFNADTGSYKQDTWQYKGKIVPSSICVVRSGRPSESTSIQYAPICQPQARMPDRSVTSSNVPSPRFR